MNDSMPTFFQRVSIAFKLFFRVLADDEFAARILKMQPGEAASPGPAPAKPSYKSSAFTEAKPDSALQLLGLLQQEGRLIDFLEEDVTGFSDTDIGAAARVVHQGCRKAIRDHFQIIPVRTEPEGSRITLPDGFDASAIRLAGNVVGKPPYTGSLVHRGWRVSSMALPKVAAGHDVHVLASAEVEL